MGVDCGTSHRADIQNGQLPVARACDLEARIVDVPYDYADILCHAGRPQPLVVCVCAYSKMAEHGAIELDSDSVGFTVAGPVVDATRGIAVVSPPK